MALMPPKKGLRVSLLPPPVRPTLRLPPFFGADALPPDEADGDDVDDEQAPSRPPPARAAPPSTAERRNVRRPKCEAATSAATSLAGPGVALISASLLLPACTARTGPRRR